MFLLFKANVNDKYNTSLVYRKGEVHEMDNKRGTELLQALPDLVEVCTPDGKAEKPSKTAKLDKKAKSAADADKATEQAPEAPETAETPEPATDADNKE